MAIQVDGEAWLQDPGVIMVSQEQGLDARQIPNTGAVEESQPFASIPNSPSPSISVRAESTANSDVLRGFVPYGARVATSLSRVFPNNQPSEVTSRCVCSSPTMLRVPPSLPLPPSFLRTPLPLLTYVPTYHIRSAHV